MSIAEEISLTERVSGPAGIAAAALSALSEKFKGLKALGSSIGGKLGGLDYEGFAEKAEAAGEAAAGVIGHVTGLGEAMKSLGPAGEMGGAIVGAMALIGSAAVKAAGKIVGAFSKAIGSIFKKKGGGGGGDGEEGGGGGGGGGEGGGGGGGGGGGTAAAAAQAAVQFTKETIAAIGEMIMEMTKAVISSTIEFLRVGMAVSIEASSFRGDAEAIIGKLSGKDDDASEEIYDKLAKLGRDTGMGRERAFDQWRKLAAGGFSDDAAIKIVQASADVDAVRGGGAGGKLTNLLNKIKTTGTMKMSDVKAAAKNLGLSEEQLIKDMAAKLGKSETTLRSELKKGLKGDQGIDAILGAVEKKYGGEAAKLAESIPETLNAIKDQIVGLFDKVNLKPLEETLQTIKKLLDDEIGKELKASVTELFSAVFEALFGETAKGGDKIKDIIKGVSGFIKGLAEAVKAVSPLIKAFVGGMLDGLKTMASGDGGKGGWMESLKEALPTLIPMFATAGRMIVGLFSMLATLAAWFAKVVYAVIGLSVALAGFSVDVWEALDGAGSAVAQFQADMWGGLASAALAVFDFINSIWGAIVSLPGMIIEAAIGIGQALVEGISNGLNIGVVVDKIMSMGSAMIAAIKAVLLVKSPSRVFEEIGGFTSEGMARGVDRGRGRVVGAVNRMGAAAAAAGASAGVAIPSAVGGAGGAEGGAGPGGGADKVEVTININGSNAEQNKQVAEAAAAEVRAYFRRRRAAG